MADLSVELLGMDLPNPTVLPSGILGEELSMLERAGASGASLLISKSITVSERPGYHGPTVIEPAPGVVLNAMGLPNPGIQEFIKIYSPIMGGSPVVPSIWGTNEEELTRLASAVDELGAPALEVNLSCPHSTAKTGVRTLAQDPEGAYEAMRYITTITSIPVIAKLSPNVTDITSIASAVLEGGASAVSAVNTFEALHIDTTLERPTLGNFRGGQSGASIMPLALRKVADIALAMDSGNVPKAPIIAYGGACNGDDLARYILAGASVVGIGTCVIERGVEIFSLASIELSDWMDGKGYTCLEEFRGNALEWLK